MFTIHTGRAEDVGLDPDRIDLVRQRLKASVDEGKTPAISALVARKGVIVLQEAFGQRSPTAGAGSLRPDDIWPVMSVGKPLASIAAMILAEDGLLSLNRRLRDYIPEVQGDGTEAILVHHLMTWTAGYREFDLFDWVARNPTKTLPPCEPTQDRWTHRWLHERYRAPLSTRPGTENSYGLHCVQLLGEIVRRVSGQSFPDFVGERVFGPLGMRDSAYAPKPGMQDRIVYRDPSLPFGDDPALGGLLKINASINIPSAAGGLLTTPYDLAVLGQTFINGGAYNGKRVLSPVGVSEMTRNQIPGIPALGFGGRVVPEASWGLGWMVQGQEKWPYWNGSLQPIGTVYHQGVGASYVWMDLKHELIGVYLTVVTESDHEKNECNWDVDLFQNMVTASILDEA